MARWGALGTIPAGDGDEPDDGGGAVDRVGVGDPRPAGPASSVAGAEARPD
ncbi:MAG: hypothetical protein H0V74_08535 [Chloroflexi bacterium]|nr:hypothetical protein [Chloroflexota bacterium]